MQKKISENDITSVPLSLDLKFLLKQNIEEHLYRMWIEPLEFIIDSESSITVLMPNSYTKKRFESEKGYLNDFKKLADQLLKRDIIVNCKVCNTTELKNENEKKGDKNYSNVVQFPIWPEKKRASPNAFLRSALFSCRKFSKKKGQERKYVKEKIISCMKGFELRFTGEELDQNDFELWLQAAHIARLSPVGNVCISTSYGLVKSIKGTNPGKHYKWLKESLKRLRFAGLEIRKKKGPWVTYNLLEDLKGHEGEENIKIKFNTDMIKLFLPNNWTALEWNERKKLKGKGLALWLHGYYSSHATPYPIKAETLWQLSGAKTPLKVFKVNGKRGGMLINALNDLSKVTGWKIYYDGHIVSIDKGKMIEEAVKNEQSDVSQYKPQKCIIEKAKEVAPHLDVLVLLEQFKNWNLKKENNIENIDSAFIGFCKKKAQKK